MFGNFGWVFPWNCWCRLRFSSNFRAVRKKSQVSVRFDIGITVIDSRKKLKRIVNLVYDFCWNLHVLVQQQQIKEQLTDRIQTSREYCVVKLEPLELCRRCLAILNLSTDVQILFLFPSSRVSLFLQFDLTLFSAGHILQGTFCVPLSDTRTEWARPGARLNLLSLWLRWYRQKTSILLRFFFFLHC